MKYHGVKLTPTHLIVRLDVINKIVCLLLIALFCSFIYSILSVPSEMKKGIYPELYLLQSNIKDTKEELIKYTDESIDRRINQLNSQIMPSSFKQESKWSRQSKNKGINQ